MPRYNIEANLILSDLLCLHSIPLITEMVVKPSHFYHLFFAPDPRNLVIDRDIESTMIIIFFVITSYVY